MNVIAEVIAEPLKENVDEWARLALEESGGIIAKATDTLTQRVLSDHAFLAVHLESIVRNWAGWRVGVLVKNIRTRNYPIIESRASVVDGTVMRVAMANETERYMNRQLWGGKPIGLATADEIYESADHYDKTARTMTRTAAWQAAVAGALEKNGDPRSTAADCLSEATLAKLWEEAGGD